MSVAKSTLAGLIALAASVVALPPSIHNPTTLSTSYGIPAPSISTPAAIPPPDAAASEAAAAANLALAKDAESDPTNVARFNTLLTVDGAGDQLLPPDQLRQRVVFDFNAAPATGEGGRFLAANVGNFPILVEQGLSTAVAFLEPCSMNSPHTHPRASEWLTVVDGKLKSGFMLENGFLQGGGVGQLTTQVSSELSAFQGTVFPQGSIHFQFNDNCAPATFVATLNSEDPGTSQVAQNFFFLDDRVVNVTLGEIQNINGKNIEQFRETLPPNLVQAMDSCFAKCGGKGHENGHEGRKWTK